MLTLLNQVAYSFNVLLASMNDRSLAELALKFFPFVLLLELPLFLLVCSGILRYGLRRLREDHQREQYPASPASSPAIRKARTFARRSSRWRTRFTAGPFRSSP